MTTKPNVNVAAYAAHLASQKRPPRQPGLRRLAEIDYRRADPEIIDPPPPTAPGRGLVTLDQLATAHLTPAEMQALQPAIDAVRDFGRNRAACPGLSLVFIGAAIDGDNQRTGTGTAKTLLAQIIVDQYANFIVHPETAAAAAAVEAARQLPLDDPGIVNGAAAMSVDPGRFREMLVDARQHKLETARAHYQPLLIRNGLFFDCGSLLDLFGSDSGATLADIGKTIPPSTPVIVLDDIGEQCNLKWVSRDDQLAEQQRRLRRVLDHCVTHQISVVFTTNLTWQALRAYLGKRCASRVLGMVNADRGGIFDLSALPDFRRRIGGWDR